MTTTSATSTNAGGPRTSDPRIGLKAGQQEDAQAQSPRPPRQRPPRSRTEPKDRIDAKAAADAPTAEAQSTGSAAERLRASARRRAAARSTETADQATPESGAASKDATSTDAPSAASASTAIQTVAEPSTSGTEQIRMPQLPKIRWPKFRTPRLRLLPAVMFCLFLMVGDRVGEIWLTMQTDRVSPVTASIAQETHDDATGPPLDLTPDADAHGANDTHESAEHAVAATDSHAVEPGHAEATVAHDSTVEDTHGDVDHMESMASDTSDHLPAPQEILVADATDIGVEGLNPLPDTLVEPIDPVTMTDSEMALLQSLAARRSELDVRESAIVEREALLTVAEQRLDEKLAELRALREELEGMLDQLDEEQEEHLQSLVRIYENMRPGDAARIFDGLDMDVLLQVLQRMSERKTAPILAAMQPERAREVTAELALRRQLPEIPE